MTEASEVVLHQFAFSHYNEKVRWALDYKGIPSKRKSLLPGPHARGIKKLSGGPTTTPLVQDGATVVSGSTAILQHLEARDPSPALYPTDAEKRREVDEWVGWLDDEIGPAVRLALFHELFDDPRFSGVLFTTDQPRIKGALYRRLFPRLTPMLCDRMEINAETAARARVVSEAGLARVDEASRETGYLVGDAFGAADLTAASLFFPLFFPPQVPFDMPAFSSHIFERWLDRWRGKPGEEYVRRMWSKHR